MKMRKLKEKYKWTESKWMERLLSPVPLACLTKDEITNIKMLKDSIVKLSAIPYSDSMDQTGERAFGGTSGTTSPE